MNMAKRKIPPKPKKGKKQPIPITSEAERFFSGLDFGNQRAASIYHLKERSQILLKHFSADRSFSRYVKRHPLSTLIESKIEKELSLHSYDVLRIARQQIDFESKQNLAKYRFLAKSMYVDPGTIFPEIPSIPYLSEL